MILLLPAAPVQMTRSAAVTLLVGRITLVWLILFAVEIRHVSHMSKITPVRSGNAGIMTVDATSSSVICAMENRGVLIRSAVRISAARIPARAGRVLARWTAVFAQESVLRM